MKSENQIDDHDYDLPKVSKVKWIAACFGLIILGFITNYSLTDKIENILRIQLSSNPSCPITYSKLNFELLFPKAILKKVHIPGSCLSPSSTNSLDFNQIKIGLVGLSLSPLGPNLEIKTSSGNSHLNIKEIFNPKESIINTQGTQFDLPTLLKLTDTNFLLDGNLQINSLIHFKGAHLNDAKILLKSKDFKILAQQINRIDIPNLNIKNLSLKSELDKTNNLKIESLVLGDEASPIRANLKGRIQLNKENIADSMIDIQGEMIFTPEFLDQFSILKLFLAQFTQKDGYYQIKLGGTLKAPIPLTQ